MSKPSTVVSSQGTSFPSLWMRTALPLLLILGTLLGSVPVLAERAGDTSNVTPEVRARQLAEQSLKAMGGQEALDATRFFRFNFFGFRTHHWDRQSGDHRLEGQTRDGDAYVVLHNINTRKGSAWLNGEALDGKKLEEWLKNAYSAWVNDTYWLLMPYKLLDPGVHLTYDGEETLDGVVYDKVLLTFDGVGLTPGDRYWAYLNRETGLMDRWAYFLEGWEEGREATHWQWTDWDRYGRILLSPRRFNPENEREALLDDLAVFDSLPQNIFTSPDAVAVD